MVFQFVRACAWHLAWHVRVSLPWCKSMRALMHACASVLLLRARMTLLDCFLNAQKPGLRQQPGQKFTLTYPHISSLCGKTAEGVPHIQFLGVRENPLKFPVVFLYVSLHFSSKSVPYVHHLSKNTRQNM
jgi:hypothetical protein